jgi:hypothetical protein
VLLLSPGEADCGVWTAAHFQTICGNEQSPTDPGDDFIVTEELRPETPPKKIRTPWIVLLVCVAPLIALQATLLFTQKAIYDFIFYWAAGQLFLSGGHPYTESAMRSIVLAHGGNPAWPVMTFCPPWGMPFIAIITILPFRTAQALWFGISLSLSGLSAIGLWLYFGGESRKLWVAFLIAATFIPLGGAELVGQITPLMLASLTAFLLLIRGRQNFAAGLVLIGLGFKPHLLYLVFLAILFWMIKTRAWNMVAGAVVSYGAALATAQLYNPNSLDYLHNTLGTALNVSCGIGGALRSIFGLQHVWLQFLPCLLGTLWFLYYWSTHQRKWDWQVHLPLVLLVSVSTSPYCWNHDFILILPALMAVAVRGAYRFVSIALAYLATQAIAFGVGLPPAWASTASLLWIGIFLLAKFNVDRSIQDLKPDHTLPTHSITNAGTDR